MKHPVIHFEIAANDPERLKRFYKELFGWKIEGSAEMPEYQMIITAEEGEPGINGGLMSKQMPQQCNLNYVSVESIETYAEKLKELGGQVVVPKMAVPKMGYFAVGLDPEGNPVGLWQTDPNAA